jgi:beta-glucosidase
MQTGYKDASLPAGERARDLLKRMTLDEKLAQLGSCWVYQIMDGKAFSPARARKLMAAGLGQVTRVGGGSSLAPAEAAAMANAIQRFLTTETRLGIPAMIHEESCSGFMTRGATCFPQTIGMACTFEPALVSEMGAVIAAQMRAVGVHQALAPLLDVTRDPRWGRTEETYGEDPHLVAAMGCAYVRGMQGKELANGVISTGKHFVGYGASEGGMNWAPSHITPRELREVYLAPFEAAVREAGLGSMMNGYHELDGVPCGCSRWLLTEVLRERWGFRGIVVSDYGAVRMLRDYHQIAGSLAQAGAMALRAGIDVELPNTDAYGAELAVALEAGLVRQDEIDLAVLRTLEMKFRLGVFERPFVDEGSAAAVFDAPAQRALARRAAAQTLVLLRNEGGLLPLEGRRRIAVIGPNADSARHMIGDYAYPCHIETLVEAKKNGDLLGMPLPDEISLEGTFVPIESMLQGMRAGAPTGTQVTYARGCDTLDPSTEGFAEAVAAARAADVAVLFVGDKAGLTPGCTTGESCDKAELTLPGVQQELVEAVCAAGRPVVVVLMTGRPYAVDWILSHVPAVLLAWLPGEEGAAAVADALFGRVNPGGKLAISMPRSAGQVPVYYSHKKSGGRSHWRGDYVDLPTSPLLPFGFGLSYTRFEYSSLAIGPAEVDGTGTVTISCAVRNVGPVVGDEVVQLYVRDPEASVTRPVKELKGFCRVRVEPGQSRTVTFRLRPAALAFYDASMELAIEPGAIEVMIGSSSEDIRLRGGFAITGERVVVAGGLGTGRDDGRGAPRVFFSESSAR